MIMTTVDHAGAMYNNVDNVIKATKMKASQMITTVMTIQIYLI